MLKEIQEISRTKRWIIFFCAVFTVLTVVLYAISSMTLLQVLLLVGMSSVASAIVTALTYYGVKFLFPEDFKKKEE